MYPKALSLSPTLLRPNPWNSNHVGPDNEAKLRSSLEELGFFRPVIVREVNGELEIIGGEHRWGLSIEMEMPEIPVMNVGPVSDEKAKKIGLIDNARYGEDDVGELAAILKSLDSPEAFQEMMPYTDAEITSIFSASNIALEDLDNIDDASETHATEETAPQAVAPKTHTMMRFQVPLADAERLTDLITRTSKRQGFDTGTALMNAGDALCHLLLGAASPAPADDDEPESDGDFGAPL